MLGAAALLAGLPLAGVVCTGKPFAPYLEFPPVTRYVSHAPFYLPAFLAMALLVLLALAPFVRRAWACRSALRRTEAPRFSFPWWGYAGLLLCAAAWVLAWTRFAWFSPLQRHTFTPLWLAYILIVNALTFRRSGRCMLRERPVFLGLLFPLSALFWWFFEYLNRFVQNWYYLEAEHFSPVEYVVFASISFSTVLPAVLCTAEFLLTFPLLQLGFGSYKKLHASRPRLLGAACLLPACLSLAGIGVFPNLLYPLLWVAPLFVMVSLQGLFGVPHAFSSLKNGDWRMVVASSLAAIVCGFFWEMWNFYSLAKWVYAIPYTQRFHLFEMPLLGYAGYLPFGLECAVAGSCASRLLQD